MYDLKVKDRNYSFLQVLYLYKCCCLLDRCLATQASYDVVVVGGGIVGLGTARELIIRHPTLKFAVVEKESELCEYKDSHLLLVELFLHEGSVACTL